MRQFVLDAVKEGLERLSVDVSDMSLTTTSDAPSVRHGPLATPPRYPVGPGQRL
jgi:hypothetical protein